MSIFPDDIQELLSLPEGEHVEFKEAKNQYSFDKLLRYVVAIANEEGGLFVFGVTDKRPRQVVGSNAFLQPEGNQRAIRDKLHLSVRFKEYSHDGKRILVFAIPKHPVGTPISLDGKYLQRDGDSLVQMTPDRLRQILAEAAHDFSGDLAPNLNLTDLDSQAIERFRTLWIEKSENTAYTSLSQEQLLRDAGVWRDSGLTWAALILFGKQNVVQRLLPIAEVIFEYRSNEASGPAAQRIEYRSGFFNWFNELWDTINLRNDLQHYQDGPYVRDIPTFAERSVREAVLNAVSHRDYQSGGSIFIRQYPHKIRIENPGGFPPGITVDNILDRQEPRNRCLAEVFARCGLIERSGQGVNLLFEESLQHGKPLPSYEGTDLFLVNLVVSGEAKDIPFVRFWASVRENRDPSLSTQQFLTLWNVFHKNALSDRDTIPLRALYQLGILAEVERSREVNRMLVLLVVEEAGNKGIPLSEIMQALPDLPRRTIQRLLEGHVQNRDVFMKGTTKNARWYATKST